MLKRLITTTVLVATVAIGGATQAQAHVRHPRPVPCMASVVVCNGYVQHKRPMPKTFPSSWQQVTFQNTYTQHPRTFPTTFPYPTV